MVAFVVVQLVLQSCQLHATLNLYSGECQERMEQQAKMQNKLYLQMEQA